MKNIAAVLGLPALLVPLAVALPAQAGGPTAIAPEPVVAPVEPYVAPGMDWSGAYAGGQLGFADRQKLVLSTNAQLESHGLSAAQIAQFHHEIQQALGRAELPMSGWGNDVLAHVDQAYPGNFF